MIEKKDLYKDNLAPQKLLFEPQENKTNGFQDTPTDHRKYLWQSVGVDTYPFLEQSFACH